MDETEMTRQGANRIERDPVVRSREHIVSRTLMAGIYVSGAFMLVGFIMYALQPHHHGDAYPVADWHWISAQLQQPTSALLTSPFLYLYIGIFILMLTPIIRIVITGWTFFRERDWHYVVVSLIVFVVIGISIALSITH